MSVPAAGEIWTIETFYNDIYLPVLRQDLVRLTKVSG